MHLALEMGCTVTELEERMTEREFVLWTMYASEFLLPNRRVELHLAQISMLIAKTMGNAGNVTLKDFMFERAPPEDKTAAPITAKMFSAVAGVHRLSQGRKRKVNASQ